MVKILQGSTKCPGRSVLVAFFLYIALYSGSIHVTNLLGGPIENRLRKKLELGSGTDQMKGPAVFIMVLKFNFTADLSFDILGNAMDVCSYLFLTYFSSFWGTNLLKFNVNKRIK